MRAPRSAKTEPKASYSVGHQPRPTPRDTRPPDSSSRVATCSATWRGWCTGSWNIPVPTRIRSVRAATAASTVSGSPRFSAMKWW